ncbi:uncharacterized protein LOC111607691 [Xiphophorus maculatus]|uniref:uncharacterized protein LOC111607691 n=1 Tax=Xiphophorus maculatus TaxID=8083 RepID=UPI000C6DC84E|nr:uncharacterized protein LOC111607691 [Xiphophorus maculatus]
MESIPDALHVLQGDGRRKRDRRDTEDIAFVLHLPQQSSPSAPLRMSVESRRRSQARARGRGFAHHPAAIPVLSPDQQDGLHCTAPPAVINREFPVVCVLEFPSFVCSRFLRVCTCPPTFRRPLTSPDETSLTKSEWRKTRADGVPTGTIFTGSPGPGSEICASGAAVGSEEVHSRGLLGDEAWGLPEGMAGLEEPLAGQQLNKRWEGSVSL